MGVLVGIQDVQLVPVLIAVLPSGIGAPQSLDVEEVHCTLMDVPHLSGRRPHQGERLYLHDKPGRECHGQHKDRHV